MDYEHLESLWESLEGREAPNRGAVHFVEAGGAVRAGEVLLALDYEERRHLLIPVANYSEVAQDTRSAGIHITASTFPDAPEASDFIDVVCRRSDLRELFSIVVSDMLERVTMTSSEPAGACLSVLNKWRDFFERETWPRLGPEQLIGLFAELKHLLEACRYSPKALTSWRGPSGDRHDFLVAQFALEVKATRSTSSFTFRISGLDQLESPPKSELLLSASRILPASESGESVPDLVKEIQKAGVESSLLFKKLAQVGYQKDHEAIYEREHFSVEDHAVYRVDDSFPKLTSFSLKGGTLPAAVSRLEYTIDLASPPSTSLTDEERIRMHRTLAGLGAQ